MQTRREALKAGIVAAGALGSASLVASPAHAFTKTAFDARTVAEAVKAFGAGPLVESPEVKVTGPEIAENGSVVPLGVSTTLAGARRLLLLVEKNPAPLVAMFNLGEAVDANFLIRSKMAQSSDVWAVAITADGKAFYAKKEVKVTLGGCGA